uniref:3-hydroxyacyl-CoA dehydrogenase type-2 n=1 Tax=Zeugodacus cucurbitae TaxID=28588 RepID=A0A0A1X8U0_ZEUCU
MSVHPRLINLANILDVYTYVYISWGNMAAPPPVYDTCCVVHQTSLILARFAEMWAYVGTNVDHVGVIGLLLAIFMDALEQLQNFCTKFPNLFMFACFAA